VTIKGITIVRVLVSGALSFATLTAIDRFAEDGLRDGLAMPGAIVSMLGSIVGLYDTPSGAWARVCIAGNFAFYATLWWVLLRVVVRVSAKAKTT
jgi:hypothetical protein